MISKIVRYTVICNKCLIDGFQTDGIYSETEEHALLQASSFGWYIEQGKKGEHLCPKCYEQEN